MIVADFMIKRLKSSKTIKDKSITNEDIQDLGPLFSNVLKEESHRIKHAKATSKYQLNKKYIRLLLCLQS